jgi:rhamnosyltransferase
VQTFWLAGLMDESLFIDFVDTEWSLRCRANGVPIRIVPTAAMRHSIGAGSVAIGRCRVVLHSPTRSYYQIRNSLFLFRRDSVPFAFALWAVFSVFLHKLLMLLFVSNRWRYIRNYFMGVWHGCRGLALVRPTLEG